MGCFALGWVVCINRAEFSGVVWSVLVGLGLPLLVVVSGVGVGYSFFFGVVWMCILGVRFVGVFKLVVLLTHGDVGLFRVYELLGCGLF